MVPLTGVHPAFAAVDAFEHAAIRHRIDRDWRCRVKCQGLKMIISHTKCDFVPALPAICAFEQTVVIGAQVDCGWRRRINCQGAYVGIGQVEVDGAPVPSAVGALECAIFGRGIECGGGRRVNRQGV